MGDLCERQSPHTSREESALRSVTEQRHALDRTAPCARQSSAARSKTHPLELSVKLPGGQETHTAIGWAKGEREETLGAASRARIMA